MLSLFFKIQLSYFDIFSSIVKTIFFGISMWLFVSKSQYTTIKYQILDLDILSLLFLTITNSSNFRIYLLSYEPLIFS